VARIGNPTDGTVTADVRWPSGLAGASECDMAERPLARLRVRDGDRVRIRLGPRKVATIRLQTLNGKGRE
jgi:hypothetical protein